MAEGKGQRIWPSDWSSVAKLIIKVHDRMVTLGKFTPGGQEDFPADRR